MPIYGLAANLAQLVALAFGIYLITTGHLTVGLLIGFQLYVTNFYSPLRQLAALWSSFQLSLASLDRISEVLSMESDLPQLPSPKVIHDDHLLEFSKVSFHYPNGKTILHEIDLVLEKGKTYALVGPTGGGKTTTASIMARLYDASSGEIRLSGRDIRTYSTEERTKKIGFILQEPFLFSGTVRDNIFYGNEEYAKKSHEELDTALANSGFADLLKRFE